MGLAKIAGKKLAEKATEGALASVAKQARAIGKKGDVIPPPFERAPAKTKEEIDAIARRVAPQLTGEFVRLDPTKSINPAGLSKKRFDIEKELEHDIRPVREVAPPSMFDYESNLGKVQLGVFGDPTISQQDIYSIAGRKLPIPSRQYGGPRYPMYEPEDAWASNFGAASGLQSSAERASKQYGGADVVGLYTKMGKDSYGFAQHLSDALMKNIMISLPDMSKKQIAGFNKMVRNNPDAKDFAGIENPDIALAQMEKNPEMRKQFSMLATTPTYTKAFNMPNGLDVVHAVLEPDLRNLERGMTGYTAIELDPNVTHLHATDRASTTTYDTRIPRKEGAEVQQLEVLAPYDLQYPDQLLAISKNPKQAPQPFGTLMMSGARQIIDPQHIDEIGLYRDFIKKYTGKKKGGKVHPDGSPRLANGASARKMVKYILKDQKFGVGGIAKKIAKNIAKDIELPPASNSARTQIVGTMPTYEKARDILGKEGIQGADIIDFGAGKGLGSTSMKADSFEPYPQGWYPTYTKSEDIPSDKYKGLLNLNVLNVLDPEMRAHTVKEIGRVMQPEGGTGLITTRGRDVMNTIGGRKGPEPMSIITSRDTYQKGFEPNELREYIKYILGSDFEYEPLNLGPAGVKVKKKADGGTITTPEIEVTPNEKLETLKEVPRTGKISGKIADILKPASRFLEKYQIIPEIPLIGGADLADITGVKGVQTLAEDMSYGYKPIRNLERGKLQTSYFDPRMLDAADLAGTAVGVPILAKNLGKTAIKEGMRQIQTGEGMLGRNVINPRMNIIKDQGGMLVGGEKALDDELIAMKRNESAFPHAGAHYVTGDKDPNAVALNQWVDTKVRKYLRNQAGTEADPILKTIESGVEHRFQPSMGDTKYYVKNKRASVGKPEEGIAKTELGKEYEYKIDSMFNPKRSEEIKDIVNDPMEFADPATAKRRKASLLRVEHDLPIQNEADLDALSLINQIPDKHVYTLSGTNITERLGLNHVSDVLMEDLRSGKLRPEQLNQMSIEKAIRRTAEYDAEKAKAMAKANASSVEGMPIPKEYNDGFKWVELKHDTDPKKTQVALKSEGEMMGHCVGGYCPEVESGEIKIFSLRGPDGKSHVTIEARPQFSMTLWRNENMDLISRNPELMKLDFNMRSLDNDDKYGRRMTERDYVREMTKEMKKRNINPIEPPSYMELHQVKGKQNKRPDDKYQSYISDFIKNNPTKHEIADVYELDNTNLMGVQNIADNGLVSKDIHNHPEVEKILKIKYPEEFRTDQPNVPKAFSRSEELKYKLFQEVARDFARQNKNYLDKDDILNHLREKYLLPKKKSGGSINLNQEYKLENMRRRYG
jgi:hypothetical protein